MGVHDDYRDVQNPGAGYGSSQQPGPLYADKGAAAPQSTKAQKPAAVRATIQDVRLHFYLPIPQTPKAYVEYLDYSWDKTGVGPFTAMSVTLSMLTDAKKGIDDFKASAKSSGTIAVYMGHTSLIKKGKEIVALGLAPQGGKKKILTNKEIVSLLEKAKANIVILAGCSTHTCVKVSSKLQKNGVIVITTASGRDGVTYSSFWARAITGFLLALVGWEFDGKNVTQRMAGTSSVQEAIDIGNKFFPKGDSFVLASGDGSIREF
jgi:hypothetical protein